MQLTRVKENKLISEPQELKLCNTGKERKSGLTEANTKDHGLMDNKTAKESKPGQMLTQSILENGKLE